MTVAVVIGLLVGLTLRRQPVDVVVADKSWSWRAAGYWASWSVRLSRLVSGWAPG
jgi:hypothetical protein